MSANTAGSLTRFGQILNLLDRTELNAVVVDVKTDWGNVTFATDDPVVGEVGAVQPYIKDIAGFLETLRVHRVYRIARVVTFKDVPASTAHPDWAVADTGGGLWQDSNGMSWLDPYNHKAWEYLVGVASAAARAGFDEIQFDYVRFPTDGDLSTIRYPAKDGRSEQRVIADFLAYARQELRKDGVPVSADVFGLVTSFTDDMGIGQHLEDIAAAVDYVSPMLYPSHYTRGNLGIDNPNASPYQTVFRSLRDARRRLDSAGLTNQTTMRPWLQDFSMGYPYGPAEVRAEIQATADAGYDGWLLWNAANVYTDDALKVTSPGMDDPFALAPGEAGPDVSVALNHHLVTGFDPSAHPFLARTTGRTLVPLRAVAEAFGAQVDWDDATRTATATWNGRQVQIPLNGREAKVAGQTTRLDQTAVIWHDRTVVPLRFLAEAFGATVTWDGANGRVDVILDGATCTPGYCQN
ncbi:MAG TPA: putative glycoside hydrolase [Symbiobacteriaceae bacterium]